MAIRFPKPTKIKVGAVTYSFLLNFNAICDIEEGLNTNLGDAINQLQAGINARYLRVFMTAGLSRTDGATVTAGEAATIVDEIGMEKAAGLIAQGIKGFLTGSAVPADGEE
jgi:hypothetical protein